MDEDDPDVLVVEQAVVAWKAVEEFRDRSVQVDPVERHDDGLLRQQVAGREQHQHDHVEPPAELGDGKGEHRRDQQRQDHARDHDVERVRVVVREVGLAPDVDVVGEVELRRPAEIAVVRGVGDGSQGGEDRPEQREEPGRADGDEERVQRDASGC